MSHLQSPSSDKQRFELSKLVQHAEVVLARKTAGWSSMPRQRRDEIVYAEVIGLVDRARYEAGGALPDEFEAQVRRYHQDFFRKYSWSLVSGGKRPTA